MCVPRSIDPSTKSPIKSRLKSVLGSVLPTSNAIIAIIIIMTFFIREINEPVHNFITLSERLAQKIITLICMRNIFFLTKVSSREYSSEDTLPL